MAPPDKDDTDVNSPNSLRRLLFCDFSEAKSEDRFYKEINDIGKVIKRKSLEPVADFIKVCFVEIS